VVNIVNKATVIQESESLHCLCIVSPIQVIIK